MAKNKHSYVAFYMDAWAGGTARMTRLVRSVYFDVCFHNWDKVEPMAEADQMLAFDDLGEQGQQILNVLVAAGKIERNAQGAVFNEKAMEEGTKARGLYLKKSGGGKKGAAATNGSGTPDKTPAAEETRLDQNPTEEEGEASPLLSAGAAETDDAPQVDPLAKVKQDTSVAIQRKADRETVVETWNNMARKHGFPAVRQMSDKRTTALNARLKQYEVDDIVKGIDLIPERAFCLKNRQTWCNIDFLLRPDSVNKLLEGAYGAEPGGEGWMGA